MEPPEPSSAKFKLWRWLLLLSVITIALGGFVWWKMRSERLYFIEPIWSYSLVSSGATNQVLTEPRQVGELWALTRTTGLIVCGRGRSHRFNGQYPVFSPDNRFLRNVSEQLLKEQRDAARDHADFQWLQWWNAATASASNHPSTLDCFCEVLFVGERAVSIKTSAAGTGDAAADYSTLFRNFVDRDGQVHELELEELFRPGDWERALSDLCIAGLLCQKSKWVQEPTRGARHPYKERRVLSDLREFTLSGVGIAFNFRRKAYGGAALDRDYVVLIPFERLAEHLRPDGPHRLFQTKVSE